MHDTFAARLMRVIDRLGKTETERAARLGYTARQIYNWQRGEGIVPTLEKLEQLGVIHLNDVECPCRAAEPSDITA